MNLQITPNLAVALRHLRDSRSEWILWIDAICINQNDLQEWSAEVRRMGDIFSIAWRTLIWLGPDDDDSIVAMEFLRLLWEYEDPEGFLHSIGENSITAQSGMVIHHVCEVDTGLIISYPVSR